MKGRRQRSRDDGGSPPHIPKFLLRGRLTEASREFAEGQAEPPLDFVDPPAPPPKLPEANEVEMTDEMRRSLKALGYLR